MIGAGREQFPEYLLVSGGKRLYIDDPDESLILIEDIATSLSRIMRFNGHTRRPYSVAEHSIWCSYIPEDCKEDALLALMHDAAEAYLGDIVFPLKKRMPVFAELERRFTDVIFRKFGVKGDAVRIKEIDLRLCETEKRDLTDYYIPSRRVRPFRSLIISPEPNTTEDVRNWFLTRFTELTQQH